MSENGGFETTGDQMSVIFPELFDQLLNYRLKLNIFIISGSKCIIVFVNYNSCTK